MSWKTLTSFPDIAVLSAHDEILNHLEETIYV